LSVATELQISAVPIAVGRERDRLVRRARLLAWGGIAWHFVEFAIAIGAGIAASSIALIGFGADSLVESIAGLVVLWRFAASRSQSQVPSGGRSS
jgi:divalent metal cation (Fe/Co/Zn/Cd) transporter